MSMEDNNNKKTDLSLEPPEQLEGEVIETPNEVFDKTELASLEQVRQVRSKLINDIVVSQGDKLANDPEMIEALSGLLNAQDAQALGTAKVRQRADLNKSADENIKALITATLQSVNRRVEKTSDTPNREERHVEVKLIEGQTSTDIKQYDLQEIEKSVSAKRGQRPSDILKEE